MGGLCCRITNGCQLWCRVNNEWRDKRCKLYTQASNYLSGYFCLLDRDACQRMLSRTVSNGIDMRGRMQGILPGGQVYIPILLHGIDGDASIGSNLYTRSIEMQSCGMRAHAMRDHNGSVTHVFDGCLRRHLDPKLTQSCLYETQGCGVNASQYVFTWGVKFDLDVEPR